MHEKELARQTLEALEAGFYTVDSGETVSCDVLVRNCTKNTRCYSPDALAAVRDQVLAQSARYEQTRIEIVNESTLAGCTRLLSTDPTQRITVLNFASAKNPGGGFLAGARAQEESLARSSGLYPSLLRCSDFYTFHRQQKSLLYSDRMIYSPDCPILRDDQGQWLAQPYTVNVITSAAPNAGAIANNDRSEAAQISNVFHERIRKLLALAIDRSCDVLLLGAWGCGAFHNDPRLVARAFHDQLQPKGDFWKRLPRVVFSVLDRHESLGNYRAFVEQFSADQR